MSLKFIVVVVVVSVVVVLLLLCQDTRGVVESVSGDIVTQVLPLDISCRKLAAGASELPCCYGASSHRVQERHRAADVTASKLASPDTEVGVDHQSADGGRRRKASLGALSSSQPTSKGG